MQKGSITSTFDRSALQGVRPRILADERGRFGAEPGQAWNYLRPESQTIENRDAMAIVRSATNGERDPVQLSAQALKAITPRGDLWSRIVEIPSGGTAMVPARTSSIADEGGRMNVSQVRRGFAKRPAAALSPSLGLILITDFIGNTAPTSPRGGEKSGTFRRGGTQVAIDRALRG